MPPSADPIPGRIFAIRGRRVILDADLAHLYGVPTKRFNEALARNIDRFPSDFAFQLTREDERNLRSQFATSSPEIADYPSVESSGSHVGVHGKRHGGRRYRPWAFTEHGALMAANLLRSRRAIEMSVYVVRAFVKQREALAANAAILKRLAEIDRSLLEHDEALRILWGRLQPLLAPPPAEPRRKIGFHEGNR